MKRTMIWILVLCLVGALAGNCCSAAAAGTQNDSENVIDAPQLGFYFVSPEKYVNTRGSLSWSADLISTGVQEIDLDYYAVAQEQMDAYAEYQAACQQAGMNGTKPPEAPDPSWMSGWEWGNVFVLYAINGGRGEAELRAVLRDNRDLDAKDFALLEEIGSVGDTRFFLGQYAMSDAVRIFYRQNMRDFYAEYEALRADKESFLSAATLSEPQWQRTLVPGETIEYEASDLGGTPRRSADIFAGAKVTMINLWATWCPPCKGELPELGAMAKEFEAKGCQVIGVCFDADSDSVAATAEAILADAGADYLNLRAAGNIDQVFPVEAIPVTLFVDSNGRILLEPIVGAYPDTYRQALVEALALAG